jgi:hypothetical protein
MAGTITFNFQFSVSNGEFSEGPITVQDSISQVAAGKYEVVVATSTTAATLAPSNLTDEGVALFRNLSTVTGEIIYVGPDSGGTMIDFIQINPGEEWPMRLKPGVTYKYKSATGTPSLRARIYEN